jgi:hypothetical protein
VLAAGITREAPKKGYFPFGYSSRSCIGATLALIEGTVMISLLAQRYTFKEVRSKARPSTCVVGLVNLMPCGLRVRVFLCVQDPGFKLQLNSGITMVAAHGVNVRVERDTEYATMKV